MRSPGSAWNDYATCRTADDGSHALAADRPRRPRESALAGAGTTEPADRLRGEYHGELGVRRRRAQAGSGGSRRREAGLVACVEPGWNVERSLDHDRPPGR